MRLFAAVTPPTEVREHLSLALPALDDRLRMVPDEQRHLTLAFYGEVPDSAVDDLQDRLGRAAARTPPLALELAGVGTFPANPDRARVLWVGIAGEVAALTRLAERCAAAGKRAGIAMETRRYRAHLTLGRSRATSTDLRDLATGELSRYAGPAWKAGRLRLVRSTLGPAVSHETLDEWAFRGATYQA
jgi:2'-5' RNA ligase